MQALLLLSRFIDAINDRIGRLMMWFVLAATLVSAGNAVIRKVLGTSSNAWLEIQWYLFAAVFMLGGGYAFLRNVHVRIDFLSSRFNPKLRNWIDIIGIVVFLFPLSVMMISEGWPIFARAWASGEMSSNAGGLIRWPVYLLIPAGFALLMSQGFSEIIKRVAFLTGHGPDVLAQKEPDEAEALARDLAREAEAASAGKA
ncbi:MAG: TRAP transporter small permease subunit [Hydrogenophaga sp.]|nr:TRAP transporter small permease subunit [Hydrogenophaga sp.]